MQKRVTLKDISEKIGVSTTTVTKALNGKDKISKEMRDLIIATANEMGYEPNKSAQALSRRVIEIEIVYPKEPSEFMGYLEKGLKKGISDLADFKVKGSFYPVGGMNSSTETNNALKEIYSRNIDGVILCPGFAYNEYSDILNKIDERSIPIIYLLNGIPDVSGIGCVKINGVVAGKLAAQFLSLCVTDSKSIALLISNKELTGHKECIQGFIEEANIRSLKVRGIYETQDDKKIAYYLTEKIVQENPDIGGIYVSSYNSVSVCNCLEDLGKDKEITVIGQDLYPSLVEKIEKESLKATLFQNPYEQGRSAVMKIYRYITENKKGSEDLIITPQLIMKSNLECYRNMY